ncbi:MAG: Transglutaminase-like superfamily protein [bacterium ADurb.Bin478]|nr:MAG: Transglutaminase-like superfamily protein [bacterium ADurb.Bin478]
MRTNFSLMVFTVAFFSILFAAYSAVGGAVQKFKSLIDQGEFTEAQKAMRLELATNSTLPAADRLELEFEIERLDRIRKDFTRSEEQVVQYIRTYIPNVTESDLREWEKEKSLECMTIDGVKRYFSQAGPNLFRIDRQARAIKAGHDKKNGVVSSRFNYEQEAAQIIAAGERQSARRVAPQRFRITYTLTVHPDAVPAGETIRVWLPYPREGNPRQTSIQLFHTSPQRHLISDNDAYLQRSIYMEQIARAGEPTLFVCSLGFTSFAEYTAIDPADVQPYDVQSALYQQYTREQPPHIVFTPELREVSEQIIGGETNPYLKAKRIFQWIDGWAPWARAREYSTIENISRYAYENRHGDCGIQTLLFMTLARLNGIPVHWQSGFDLKPGEDNLHDWCEMYLEPYGWVLVDQSYGMKNSKDERVKWFCLGNTDPYRWIVNDDFSQPLYPAKIFPRSETVDFQRGEVEWRGGNLYFDAWDYNYRIDYLGE